MPDKSPEEPRPVALPGWIILFVCLGPVALLLATTAGFGWAMHKSLESERMAWASVQVANNALDACRITNSGLTGRVRAYEGILVRPHTGALQAALREYEAGPGGSEETADQDAAAFKRFATWLRAEKGR